MFPISFVTKLINALLLAQLVVDGKESYVDPAIEFADRSVTYHKLVTHTSGLLVMPPKLPADPVVALRAFIKRYSLTYETGRQFEYATTGFGVLRSLSI